MYFTSDESYLKYYKSGLNPSEIYIKLPLQTEFKVRSDKYDIVYNTLKNIASLEHLIMTHSCDCLLSIDKQLALSYKLKVNMDSSTIP